MTVASPSATALTAFHYQQTPVRTIERSGSPWFVAVDIAASLGIKNIRESVTKLDDDEKATVGETYGSSNGVVQRRELIVVSESGLYTLILRSNKPEAKKFRRWVTGEVLPAIRRHGSYDSRPSATLIAPPDDQARLQAQLAACQSVLLRHNPALKKYLRYVSMGLNQIESARVLGCGHSTVAEMRRASESMGLLKPPADLARRQAQMLQVRARTRQAQPARVAA